MKLASYVADGKASYGIVENGYIIDLGARLGDRYPTLRALLAGDGVDEARALAQGLPGDVALERVRLLPVIPDAEKIFCIGHNYEAHRVETGRAATEHPTVFLRHRSSQQGHNDPLVLPRESTAFDFEGEIALVIGKGGRRIPAPQAACHIAGFACYNDASVRDWQTHSTQWTPGKNFPFTGAFGPWMVTADELMPGTEMTLVTRLNGVEVQRASTSWLIRPFEQLISYVSTFCELEPGDVIVTGTPGGIGAKRTPPLFMKPGDIVEVEVDRIGTLSNRVAAEDEVAEFPRKTRLPLYQAA